MSDKLIAALMGLSASGKYAVTFALMAIQSACIPIPSEVIMPFAGAALAHGRAQLIFACDVSFTGIEHWVDPGLLGGSEGWPANGAAVWKLAIAQPPRSGSG